MVQGRVLNVDVAARRLSLTLKPALLGSKLPPITSALGLTAGARSHGVVSGVKVGPRGAGVQGVKRALGSAGGAGCDCNGVHETP